MRKEFVLLVGAVALFGSATGALAGAYGEGQQVEEAPAAPPPVAMEVEQETDYAATGCYIGAGGNYAIELFERDNQTDNSSGFFVRTGYRLHPNVAVELRYDNFLEFDLNHGSLDGWQLTANAKGYMLTGRWQPFAVIGVGYIDMDQAHNDAVEGGDSAVMRFGLGMDAYITEHVSMGPEVAYVLPFGDASDFDMVTVGLGLNYRF